MRMIEECLDSYERENLPCRNNITLQCGTSIRTLAQQTTPCKPKREEPPQTSSKQKQELTHPPTGKANITRIARKALSTSTRTQTHRKRKDKEKEREKREMFDPYLCHGQLVFTTADFSLGRVSSSLKKNEGVIALGWFTRRPRTKSDAVVQTSPREAFPRTFHGTLSVRAGRGQAGEWVERGGRFAAWLAHKCRQIVW